MRFSWIPLAVVAACSMACGGTSGTTNLLGDASVSTTSDGGPGGNTQTVPCGANACNLPAQSCCVYETQPAWSYVCIDGASCPLLDGGGGGGQGTALACSGAANCADGTVCCVFQGQNNQVQSSCMTSCPANGAQLCDPSAANPGCAASAPCSSANISDWGLPKGFATCGGVGN